MTYDPGIYNSIEITHNSPSQVNGKCGFTLLEVLVALSIAGIALLGLLQLHLISIATADKAEILSQAVLLAQSKIAETEASNDQPASILSGTDNSFQTPLHWQMQTNKKPVSSLGLTQEQLHEVIVRIWWDHGRGKRHIEMSTIIAQRQESGT